MACWQVQSKLATVALLALITLSVWLALAVMLLWSVAATGAYYLARQRGMPDILARSPNRGAALRTGQILGSVWLVGFNAFAFASLMRPLLRDVPISRRSRLARGVIFGTGLTLFGVTINHHMLQSAGYRGPKLLALTLLGSLLNVPYRVFCGAITLKLVMDLANLQSPASYI